jgi:epoxide hydrolase-like predicted phosphatase
MIRNIIFDLGNVLISFIPSEYLKKKNYPEFIQQRIIKDIFKSEEWKKLDNGDITIPEAIESISRKSALKREEIALVFNFRTDIMFPLDENVRTLPELKKQGYKLYYLSNFPLDSFEEVRNDYYFFRYFDGGIISAQVKLSKPDPRIYRQILITYNLSPEECLYIDDIQENVNAAESVGMQTLFTNGSPRITSELSKKLNISLEK